MTIASLTTVTKVAEYFKQDFSSTTRPNITSVEGWIDEASAIIYSSLGTVYTVPVTDPDDLKILRTMANMYVREEVMFANSRGTNTTATGRFNAPKQANHSRFYDMLKSLVAGDMVLRNTARLTSDDYTGSYSYDVENRVEFVSDKDEQQW